MPPSRARKMVGRTTGLRGDARPWRRTRRARRASGDCKKKSMSPHFANGFRVRVRALSTGNQPTSPIAEGLATEPPRPLRGDDLGDTPDQGRENPPLHEAVHVVPVEDRIPPEPLVGGALEDGLPAVEAVPL